MTTLNNCISKYDSEVTYTINQNPGMLEIHKALNNIYDFKWVFYLTRLNIEVNSIQISKRLLKNLLVLPLFTIVSAQDTTIKHFEEQYKKNANIDISKINTQILEFNIPLNISSNAAISECFNNAIKTEETKFQKENEIKKKNDGAKAQSQQLDLKRKNNNTPVLEKKRKENSLAADYQETEIGAKRKRDFEAKLKKKKERKTLDFM